MGITRVILVFSVVFFYVLSPIYTLPLAPALYVFGDSLVDSGNNNNLMTVAKVNYKPYGADFPKGPTGRFTNGRTVADFIAEYLGLPYSPPFLSRDGPRSLTGINYASGSCGIMPETGKISGRCISLLEQINYFEGTVQRDLRTQITNPTQLSEHISKSIYLFSIGSNDYLLNYLLPMNTTSKLYQPEPFAQVLIDRLSQQLKRVYNLGARKIVVFNIGPLGCIPAITRTHPHVGDCDEKTNQLVAYYNDRLNAMLTSLRSSLPGSKIVLGQANSLVNDALKNPSKYGLTNVNNPCCTSMANGTATCVPNVNPCVNSKQHFFWDAYHLTEAAYSIVASRCFSDKSACTPVNIQELVKM
ncbi:hypothetical protein RIF29_19288 [Crotalaria pallida]|uniref:Uncharacterized protein n=1 Tax=Crotalaria pallida TaxID=3830 RepID=A0AAN9EZ98_CROPI